MNESAPFEFLAARASQLQPALQAMLLAACNALKQ